VDLPTSRNPDTPEGLKSRLSVVIHKILAELLHSTELELSVELSRSSYSEDSQQARKSSRP
jgi:hypothetical protein